jgi:hypothetical protein
MTMTHSPAMPRPAGRLPSHGDPTAHPLEGEGAAGGVHAGAARVYPADVAAEVRALARTFATMDAIIARIARTLHPSTEQNR